MNDPWWLAGGVSPADCVAAYQPMGAASLAASYINLANPDQGTYNAKPGVAPTFNASTGWTFNGSTQYLRTWVVPSAYTWSMIFRFQTTGTAQAYIGSADFSGVYERFYMVGRSATETSRWGAGSGDELIGPSGLTNATMAIAGLSCYVSGNYYVAGTGSWTVGANEIHIGAINLGSGSTFGSGSIQAAAIYNTAITADRVAAITTAMNALTEASLPTHHMPSSGMRRWARLYSQQGATFIPAWARNSNRIITPGVMLP